MRRPILALLSVATLLLSACNPPTAQPLAIFRDVRHPIDWDDERVQDAEIATEYPVVDKIPRFVRQRDRLYLLVQVTQARLLMTQVVFQEPITPARIAALRAQHPELAPLLPTAPSTSERHPETPGPTR